MLALRVLCVIPLHTYTWSGNGRLLFVTSLRELGPELVPGCSAIWLVPHRRNPTEQICFDSRSETAGANILF